MTNITQNKNTEVKITRDYKQKFKALALLEHRSLKNMLEVLIDRALFELTPAQAASIKESMDKQDAS